MGYVVGGLIVGVLADAIDPAGAIAVVAGLTAASGIWVAIDMPGSPKPALEIGPARASRPSNP